jgi:Flp pilus assembly protein TadG
MMIDNPKDFPAHGVHGAGMKPQMKCSHCHRQAERSWPASARQGSALVEFALVMPLLIVLSLGLSWFGLLFGWKHVLNNSAREGARLAAVDCSKSDQYIKNFVKTRANILPNAASITVAISATTADGTSTLSPNQRSKGGAITVTVHYTARGVFIPDVIVGDRQLTSASTFRMECTAP